MKQHLPLLVVVGLVIAALTLSRPLGPPKPEPSQMAPPAGGGGEITVVSGQKVRLVLREAEDAVEMEFPVQLAEDVDGASHGRCCYLGPEKVNESDAIRGKRKGIPEALHPGFARYSIRVPTAEEYVIWVRTRWSDDCGDSLDVALNGKYVGTITGNAGRDRPRWRWYRVGAGIAETAIHLAPDQDHSLTLCNREDELHFDQILLVPAAARYEPRGVVAP